MNFLDLPDLFRDRVVAFCDAQTIVNLRSRSETVRISLRGPKNKFEPDLKVDHATIFTTTFQKMLSGQEFLKKNSVEIGRKRLTTSPWRHHYVIVTSWWEKSLEKSLFATSFDISISSFSKNVEMYSNFINIIFEHYLPYYYDTTLTAYIPTYAKIYRILSEHVKSRKINRCDPCRIYCLVDDDETQNQVHFQGKVFSASKLFLTSENDPTR